jgi:protein KTI12
MTPLLIFLICLDVNEEKKVRAALLAASERFVSKDTILILDSLNYIKGFRYQLYCQARAAATSHLVIHCQAREDTCRYWNGLKSTRAYPSDQLEDLILRFEAPNNQTKWDSPLFGIVTEGSTDQELSNLFHSLLPVITSSPNRPPSTATLTTKPTSSNSIQILDHETQAIIDTIIKHQQDQLPLVKFSQTAKTLALPRPVSVATLSRVRRQFLHLNRLHPTTDPEKIRSLFIDFLAANMYL